MALKYDVEEYPEPKRYDFTTYKGTTGTMFIAGGHTSLTWMGEELEKEAILFCQEHIIILNAGIPTVIERTPAAEILYKPPGFGQKKRAP